MRAPVILVMAARLVLAVAATVPVRVAVLAVVMERRVRAVPAAVVTVAVRVVPVRVVPVRAVAALRAASALSVPSRAHPSVPNVLRSVLSVRLVSVAVPAVLRVSRWRVRVAAPATALKARVLKVLVLGTPVLRVLAVRAVALTVLVLKARAGVGYFSIPGTCRALLYR